MLFYAFLCSFMLFYVFACCIIKMLCAFRWLQLKFLETQLELRATKEAKKPFSLSQIKWNKKLTFCWWNSVISDAGQATGAFDLLAKFRHFRHGAGNWCLRFLGEILSVAELSTCQIFHLNFENLQIFFFKNRFFTINFPFFQKLSKTTIKRDKLFVCSKK